MMYFFMNFWNNLVYIFCYFYIRMCFFQWKVENEGEPFHFWFLLTCPLLDQGSFVLFCHGYILCQCVHVPGDLGFQELKFVTNIMDVRWWALFYELAFLPFFLYRQFERQTGYHPTENCCPKYMSSGFRKGSRYLHSGTLRKCFMYPFFSMSRAAFPCHVQSDYWEPLDNLLLK